MDGTRNHSLLVLLAAVFIVLAFLLSLTLVLTAGPFSDPGENLRVNMSILMDDLQGTTTQCLVDDEIPVHETCPETHESGIFYSGYEDP